MSDAVKTKTSPLNAANIAIFSETFSWERTSSENNIYQILALMDADYMDSLKKVKKKFADMKKIPTFAIPQK